MDLSLTISELIDTRSFSNVWYWITLAVFWSAMSHYVIGVPFDLVQRVQRQNEPTGWHDLERISRIQAQRLSFIGSTAGLLVGGVAGFLLTVLFLLGFFYWIELCQAMFLIVFPFCLIGLLSQHTARSILVNGRRGEDLVRDLRRHRFLTQVLGIISIFITAFWGIWQAMSLTVLGN